MSEPVPEKCPLCGKRVPKVDPETAVDLLRRHLVKCEAKQAAKEGA